MLTTKRMPKTMTVSSEGINSFSEVIEIAAENVYTGVETDT
ncbi:hypothetical protein ALCH109712_05890 [Alkalicoccus chagannorensis]